MCVCVVVSALVALCHAALDQFEGDVVDLFVLIVLAKLTLYSFSKCFVLVFVSAHVVCFSDYYVV